MLNRRAQSFMCLSGVTHLQCNKRIVPTSVGCVAARLPLCPHRSLYHQANRSDKFVSGDLRCSTSLRVYSSSPCTTRCPTACRSYGLPGLCVHSRSVDYMTTMYIIWRYNLLMTVELIFVARMVCCSSSVVWRLFFIIIKFAHITRC